MRKLTTLLFLITFLASTAFGQSRFVTGTVQTVEGEPLIGATIKWADSKEVTVSDVEGQFKILVIDSLKTLEISHTGYETLTKTITNLAEKITITLSESDIELEEVWTFDPGTSTEESKVRAKKSEGSSLLKMSTRSVSDIPTSTLAYSSESSSAYESGGAIRRNVSGVQAGTLTAGEIHDFSKWQLWQDIAKEDLQEWQEHWLFRPLQRYTVQVVTKTDDALADATVLLKDKKGNTVWTARTDNTGKAELWANFFSEKKDQQNYSLEIQYNNRSETVKAANAFHNGINVVEIAADCAPSNAVDVAFVVDATGSMSDEIAYLKAELNDVIDKVKDTLPVLDLSMSSVFYRDEGDDYVVRKSPFSKDISQTIDFIKEQQAGGGGDTPEAVEQALEAAINQLEWRSEARARLLFLVLDAPPHHTPDILQKLEKLATTAAAKGIRIIPVSGSGIDKSTEYLMRALALATNGTYVFLTDHSGVGNPHLEPTTDEYEVEKFNDLLVRLFYQYTYMPDCSEDIALFAPATETDNSSASAIKWKYYPNPTSGVLTVEIEGDSEELFLADMSGKILKRFLLKNSNRLQIDISDFPTGMYFLKIPQAEEKWLSGQVILTRA